jgi:hypothetical protein
MESIKGLSEKFLNLLSKYSAFIFIFSLLAISYFYDYHKILNKRPQSLHHWRQTECTSLALNYYQNGMNFFKPEIHLHIADDYNSGYTVGEFPIIYYIVANLYHLFGFHESIFRATTLLLFFIGLFAVFRTVKDLLSDEFWAWGAGILLFMSPVVVFYANNFLPDVPALSLALTGWLFFYTFYKTKKDKWLTGAAALFLLAGLIKITASMSLILLIIILIAERLFRSEARSLIFFSFKKHFLILTLPLVAIAAWYITAINYNKNHNVTYFSTRTWPIWDMSSEEISSLFHKIMIEWRFEYFHTSIWVLTGIAILIFILKSNFINRFFLFGSLILFSGSALFIMLWFFALRDHDYYIINLLLLPLLMFIGLLDYLKNNHYRLFKSWALKIGFFIIVVINIVHAQRSLNDRYFSWKNELPLFKDVHEVEPYLRSLGISRTDKVISTPDDATNYTLYLMNQPGWTEHMGVKLDSLNILRLKEKGAKYLIINDKRELEREELKPFIHNRVGEYNNISIFKL